MTLPVDDIPNNPVYALTYSYMVKKIIPGYFLIISLCWHNNQKLKVVYTKNGGQAFVCLFFYQREIFLLCQVCRLYVCYICKLMCILPHYSEWLDVDTWARLCFVYIVEPQFWNIILHIGSYAKPMKIIRSDQKR